MISFRLAGLLTGVNPEAQGLDSLFVLLQNAINIALFIAGAMSVIFVVIGALKYTASAGNPAAVTAAKKTITYALVGLVLAIMALAIVNFAQGLFKP